jgi:hypothetical protein
LGFTGCHSEERFVDQRLGSPGVFPEKLRSAKIASSLPVRAGLSLVLMPEENPT